jgi:adenylate cyclase class IV
MPRNIEIKVRLPNGLQSGLQGALPQDLSAAPAARDSTPRQPPPALAAVLQRALALAASGRLSAAAGAQQLPGAPGPVAQPLLIEQDDTFYPVPHGRLKLRRLADGSAELIHYSRADDVAARASDYVRVPVPDAAAAQALDETLQRALGGSAGRVRKRRWLVLLEDTAGFHTRVHLDAVAELGAFVELEVVLKPGQTDAQGQAVAEDLLQALGLAQAPRVAAAYRDLLVTAALTRG